MHEQTAEALLELYRHAVVLKFTPRTGWLQRGVAQPESVAEHSYGVALLALLVADQTGRLDRGKLLAIALLHDLAEAMLGDLPASARRLLGAEAKHAAERRAMEELLAALPQSDYLALWDEYARGVSPEARLVKGLDRIEMLVQALAYERAGSRALDEFWADTERDWGDEFPILRELALSLLAQRTRLTGAPGHAPPDSH